MVYISVLFIIFQSLDRNVRICSARNVCS